MLYTETGLPAFITEGPVVEPKYSEETLLGMSRCEVKWFVNEVANRIKQEIKAMERFAPDGPQNIMHQSLNRRDVQAHWFRVRHEILTLLVVLDDLDETSNIAVDVRQAVRFSQRVMDDVPQSSDSVLRDDIALLRKFMANGVNVITRHHFPQHLQPRMKSKQRTEGAERSNTDAELIDQRARVLEFIATLAPLCGPNVDLAENDGRHYAQANLEALHDACLQLSVEERSQLRLDWEELTPFLHGRMGFLFRSVDCVMRNLPSPLVAERKAAPATVKKTVESPNFIAVRTLLEQHPKDMAWAKQVLRGCQTLSDNEVLGVLRELGTKLPEGVCVISVMAALYVQRHHYRSICDYVYNKLQDFAQEHGLSPAAKRALQTAEARLGGRRIFRFAD